MAGNQNQVLGHVYSKTFDWLDRALHGVAPDVEPEADLASADPPELQVLIEKCRTRMTKLLLTALDDGARGELAQFLTTGLGPAGAVSHKARKMREERLTERWLAGHFGHSVPTAAGWRDPRET